MDSSQPNPEYISYQVYRELKEQFDRALKLETDKDTFDKILKNISYVPNKRNSGINVLTNLHNISRNDPAFLSGQGPNYCKYINFWLNKEIQNTNNRLDSSYIKIFQDFSHEFRHDRSGNYENSCKNYISNLDDETIIKMKFLYDLYDSYNEIKSQPIKDRINTCDKLDRLAISYHFSIDNYYDKDQNLYKELDNIQKLILGKIGNINPPCEKKIYFKKPINLVLQEQQALRETEEKAAREAEEKAAREAEEKAAREAREKEAQKLLIEKDREQPDISLKSQDNESQEMSHGNREFQSSGYPGGTRVLGNSGLHRSTQRFGYSERSKSSRAWLLGDIHTTEEQFIQTKDDMEHQVGVDYEQPDTDRTRSGTIGGLSGFPSSITEVLGSVDPVPVVGVSGGMGALFLLFRYTPLGTFFRGGRGRVHRIPRSFNGQFLGAFPDINEYNGGNIGYGPMDIPYGAE